MTITTIAHIGKLLELLGGGVGVGVGALLAGEVGGVGALLAAELAALVALVAAEAAVALAVLAALEILIVGAGVAVAWLTSSRARPVTLRQAEIRLGSGATGSGGAARPAPGVYEYRGSGTETLSLPPLSRRKDRPYPAR